MESSDGKNDIGRINADTVLISLMVPISMNSVSSRKKKFVFRVYKCPLLVVLCMLVNL